MAKKGSDATIPRSDRIAIGVACATAAFGIVANLIPKTRTTFGFSLTCAFVAVAYPILNFVRPMLLKVVAVIAATGATLYLGVSYWPGPTSDLRFVDGQMNPLEVGKPVALNVHITNDGTQTIQANIFDLISITTPVGSMDEEVKTQEAKWEVLRKFVAEANPESSPYPPKALNWRTITDPRAILAQEHVRALQSGSGAFAIRFMSAMQYTDQTGEHETDYCIVVQKFDILYSCKRA
jgi:hypothetical protein